MVLVPIGIAAIYWWQVTLFILLALVGAGLFLFGLALIFHKQIERSNQKAIEDEIDNEDDP